MDKLYYVYIIENLVDGSWYIGFTTNVDRRVSEHDQKIGGDYTGKKIGSWQIIYVEGYFNKADALGREKYLKTGAGRKYLKKQLANYCREL